eukprot:Rmarinus@m.5975
MFEEEEGDGYISNDFLLETTGSSSLEDIRQLTLQCVHEDQHHLCDIGERLPNLQELKLRSSSIRSLRCLGTRYENLSILWLTRVGLTELDGSNAFAGVRELYLSYNDIDDLSPFSAFAFLEVLDLESNNVTDPDQLEFLIPCRKLHSLTLKGNPVSTQDKYEATVIDMLPSLEILDDEDVIGECTPALPPDGSLVAVGAELGFTATTMTSTARTSTATSVPSARTISTPSSARVAPELEREADLVSQGIKNAKIDFYLSSWCEENRARASGRPMTGRPQSARSWSSVGGDGDKTPTRHGRPPSSGGVSWGRPSTASSMRPSTGRRSSITSLGSFFGGGERLVVGSGPPGSAPGTAGSVSLSDSERLSMAPPLPISENSNDGSTRADTSDESSGLTLGTSTFVGGAARALKERRKVTAPHALTEGSTDTSHGTSIEAKRSHVDFDNIDDAKAFLELLRLTKTDCAQGLQLNSEDPDTFFGEEESQSNSSNDDCGLACSMDQRPTDLGEKRTIRRNSLSIPVQEVAEQSPAEASSNKSNELKVRLRLPLDTEPTAVVEDTVSQRKDALSVKPSSGASFRIRPAPSSPRRHVDILHASRQRHSMVKSSEIPGEESGGSIGRSRTVSNEKCR